MSSQKDLSKLFQSKAKTLGLDDDASSTLIANLNPTTMPMCVGSPFDDDELETDDFRLVFFLVDGSDSMKDVEQDVIDSFNEIIIPGLLGGAKKQVGALRYGGLVFGSTVQPLWGGGWQKLTDNPPKLTKADYHTQGATAFHQAVLDGVTAATSYALQIADTTGTHPEVVIAALTDGANNQPPIDARVVLNVTSQLSRELFTLPIIWFQTWETVDIHKVAAAVGFPDVEESKAKPGETTAEMRKRFRNKMKVFSEKLVSRVSTSRVGQSTSQGASGFWSN